LTPSVQGELKLSQMRIEVVFLILLVLLPAMFWI